MNFPSTDPIPIPAPVWLMKLLSLVTLALHFAAVMILVGSLVLVIFHSLKGKDAVHHRAAAVLARRLPTTMTFVINLGVPPLLFLQVLYGRAVYTSSVLIAVFWISIIFQLMLAYWLLYRTQVALEKGKAAWETYLKLAPDSEQRTQIEAGLQEIEAGLRGEGRLAQPLVPARAQDGGGDAPKNVMGGARSLQSSQSSPSSQEAAADRVPRVDQLPKDASVRQKALAEGMDALDARDLALAESKLQEVAAVWDDLTPEGMVGLGRVYVQTGRVAEALRTFGEVIKRMPDFMPAWHYNGMAHMMSGSPAEAVTSWEKIVEKDPAYANRFQLEQRIAAAKRMAR